MTKAYQENIEAAFLAWQFAIQDKTRHQSPSNLSLEDLVKQYGLSITDQSCLDEVREWFNWDKIDEYLKRQTGEPDVPDFNAADAMRLRDWLGVRGGDITEETWQRMDDKTRRMYVCDLLEVVR